MCCNLTLIEKCLQILYTLTQRCSTWLNHYELGNCIIINVVLFHKIR